jgi:hypothetical protein
MSSAARAISYACVLEINSLSSAGDAPRIFDFMADHLFIELIITTQIQLAFIIDQTKSHLLNEATAA